MFCQPGPFCTVNQITCPPSHPPLSIASDVLHILLGSLYCAKYAVWSVVLRLLAMQEDETCKYLQQDWSDSPPHFAWISVEFTSDSIPGLIGDVIHRLDGAVTWSLAKELCSVLWTFEAIMSCMIKPTSQRYYSVSMFSWTDSSLSSNLLVLRADCKRTVFIDSRAP